MSRIVYIDSDGDAVKSVITLADGTRLDGCSSAEITIQAGCVNTVRLTFMHVSTHFVGHVTEISMICAVCGHEDRHQCDPSSHTAPE